MNEVHVKNMRGCFLTASRICLLATFCIFGAACAGSAPAEATGPELKIAYYKQKIAEYPDHYPAHAMLAAAYLEKVRETGDPADLKLARLSADKSNEIQPNYEAFKTLAQIEGFAHKFEKSLLWAEKALEGTADSKANGELAAIMVDAYLGLERHDEAEKLLATVGKRDFYTSAASGHLLKSLGKTVEAAAAYQEAARFARAENAGKAEAWAQIMTAGLWLDSGNPDKALEFIDKAERILPTDMQVSIHRAEYYLAKKQPEKAVSSYLRILKSSNDPEIHRRLFLLEKNRGNLENAKKHFTAAEAGFRRALDAGEVYTLGTLAQLFCDAGTDLNEARDLSKKNLLHKKDKEARDTEKCIEDKLFTKNR